MSAVLTLDRQAALGVGSEDHDVPPTAIRGRSTLDDVIVEAWEGVATHHEVSCPVCAGPMALRYGSAPRPVAARCRDCGTALS